MGPHGTDTDNSAGNTAAIAAVNSIEASNAEP